MTFSILERAIGLYLPGQVHGTIGEKHLLLEDFADLDVHLDDSLEKYGLLR